MMVLMDVILIATPWVTPQTECFAVTVPAGARDEEPLRGYVRAYALVMGLLSLACIVAMVAASPLLESEISVSGGNVVLPVLVSAFMLAPVAASFALMLHYRRKVQAVKEERGWQAEHVRGAALVGPEDIPEPITMLWDLGYIPLVVVMVVFALANYDRFPDMLPMNASLDGGVEAYVPKSIVSVLFPALVTCFMGLVMAASHWGIANSKRPIDPNAPVSSALAYGSFARKMSVALVGGGLVLCAAIGVTYYASALGAIPLMTSAIALMAFVLVYSVAMAVIGLRLGQAGARLRGEMGDGAMARDDDERWKLGAFYVNRDDPSIFVPKRFGIGWTMNLARPGSWALFLGIITVTAALVVVLGTMMLEG